MAHQERITVNDIPCIVINFSVDENKDSAVAVAGEGEEKLLRLMQPTILIMISNKIFDV